MFTFTHLWYTSSTSKLAAVRDHKRRCPARRLRVESLDDGPLFTPSFDTADVTLVAN